MFGFYYTILGLIFGTLCSIEAKKRKISNTEWFTLGFAFNIAAFAALLIYSFYALKHKNNNENISINTLSI